MLGMSVQASVPGAFRRTAGVALLIAGVVSGAVVGAPDARAQDASPVDGRIAAGGVLRVSVPEAFGAKTVIGQLTVDRTVGAGFVTAYGCADGLPVDTAGNPTRSDLNYDRSVGPVASNRLVVQADEAGDICFYTLQPAALIVDVNATTFDTGITSFPNRRTDTRDTSTIALAAGGVLRVDVPEAVGGKTVVGQLTVDRAQGAGFVTAYGCDDGLPVDGAGTVTKSDLNYDSAVSPVASNRLIVQADSDGDVCFYTLRPAALVVDVNGVSDGGIASFPNHRTDTRTGAVPQVAAGGLLRVNVPEAVGAKTVVGQLSVDRLDGAGFVTAYGCDDGIPTDAAGAVSRSDLNYDSAVSAVASNRLIVQADADGDVCFFTLRPAALVVDVNAVSAVGISSFPNQRTDSRTGGSAPGGTGSGGGVPTWPSYEPLPAVAGVAALTGLAADASVTSRPVVAVKIDNYWRARPQWGLDEADVVVEENVEGVTRFVALFHSRTPAVLGPVRSARTGDLDLLAAMNRPVFAYSGANAGVTEWIASATASGLLVDYTAQRRPCYFRTPDRPGPHNLLLDPTCSQPVAAADTPGPARPMWPIDAGWAPPAGVAATPDTTFPVPMDGVAVTWAWDAATGVYVRSQDGEPHVAASGARLAASNVVVLSVVHVPSPVDARSPNPITVGTGSAVVHRDGVAIAAVWSRATPYDGLAFLDVGTGAPLPLDTGVTFVELTRA